MIGKLKAMLSWRFAVLCPALGGLAFFVVRFPIMAMDYDLWYHLLGGVYILTHHVLPAEPFFSYLSVSSGWVDYYWLFQVLVASLHQLGGYAALVVVRSLLYLWTVVLIWLCLRGQEENGDNGVFLLALAMTCAYAMAILPRDLNLRPHIFTYLFIVLFHYVVGGRPGYGWWLPVVALVWTNVHGVEYPILLLTCGAYLAEYFLAKLLRRSIPENLRRLRWPLILSLYAVLATPAGVGLLPKPFAPPLFHERVISELNPQSFGAFFSLSLYPGGNWLDTAANGLVLLVAVSVLALAWSRRLRLSRLVLFAGGLFLLPQSRRFTYEFLLLCLPIAADVLRFVAERRPRPVPWKGAAAAALVMVAATLWSVSEYVGHQPRYPLDIGRLPVGTCEFLLRRGPGGRVLNVANPGGYLEWRLYPNYKIFMDMQTMLFPSFDLFMSLNMFSDKQVFKQALDQYAPGFILTSVRDKDFLARMDGVGDFEPVFFDDVLTLYADAKAYPDLVAHYRLRELDPATCVTEDYEAMEAGKREKIFAECRRVLDEYPDGLVANTVAAKILLAQGKTQEAMAHAARLMDVFPERYIGYALAGLAAFKEERYEAALTYNEEALARSMPAERVMVVRNLYATYARLKRFDKAYATLESVVNPMAAGTSFSDLADMGMAAVASGRTREGRLLLSMALAKATASDASKVKEIEELLRMMPATEQ